MANISARAKGAVAVVVCVAALMLTVLATGSPEVGGSSARASLSDQLGPLTPYSSSKNFTSPNAQSNGGFGESVAMSGTTLVVGAPDETASGYNDAGHVYVFKEETGELMTTLTSPNAQTEGYFGHSVAISGTTVVVGADGETASEYADAGHAYVLEAGTGALVATLASANPQSDGDFGRSVAIFGTLVVVGGPFETAAGYGEAGHAYVFKK